MPTQVYHSDTSTLPVMSGVFEASIEPGDLCQEPAQWPVCDACGNEVRYGRRVIGLPRAYRPAFLLHYRCWEMGQ